MVQKRIETDLFLKMSIVSKDGSPVDFTDAERMKVIVWNTERSYIRSKQNFKVEGNVISFQYSSEENQRVGPYGVSVLWSKKDPGSETGRRDYAVDILDAFNIVQYSGQQDDETIEHTGVVDESLPTGGSVDLSDYYNKSKVDSLLGEKVDAVPGKGLSSVDYTKEDQIKLIGLNNYDDTELRRELVDKVNKDQVYTKKEVDDKVLGSSSMIFIGEQEVGIFKCGNDNYTIYELTAEISNLPIISGQSADVVISDTPLGNNLYLKVDCFCVSAKEGFPISAYGLKKIYVHDDGTTRATVVCHEVLSGDVKAILTIRYIKGLLSYDTFRFSIPVSELGITSVDDVNVGMSPLKYNKRFVFSWTTDDGLLSIYSLMHKYINKKYIDDEYNYHDGMTPTTGMTPTRVLCSTDGCGNDVRFRLDSGWVSYNSNKSDGIHSDSYPYVYIRWSEMNTFLDFFNTAMNHGGGDENNPAESLQMCGDRLYEKTGYFPFLMIGPGGKEGFKEAADKLEYIYHYHQKGNTNYSVDSLTKDSFKIKSGVLSRKTYDGMTYQELCAYVDAEASRVDHPYVYLGGHRVSDTDSQIEWTNAVKPFLDYLYDTYGKGGDDSIWFAGPEEVYEYLFTKVFSVVKKEIVDGNLVVDIKVAKLPLFKRNEYSLLLSKPGGIQSTPSVSVDRDVVRMSTGISDNMLLVNVNYNNKIVGLAEKYTAKYEASGKDEDKEDGMFFASMLKTELSSPFLERLGAQAEAPVLNSITINSGVVNTYDRHVVIRFDLSGSSTHYRIGESSDMSGTEWKSGNLKQYDFTLSEGVGQKTVYAQVKNAIGESEIKSASIELAERPAVVFTVKSEVNNADYGKVAPATQDVEEGGEVRFIGTANEGYIIDSWVGATSYTGVGAKSGTATIANVLASQTVTCNFKKEDSSGNTKMKLSLGEPYLSDVYDEASGINRVMSSTSSKDLLDSKGGVFGKVVAIRAKTSSNLYGKKTGDDSGAVPDFVADSAVYAYLSASSGTSTTIDYTFAVPVGRYKMGIMANVDSACPWGDPQNIITDLADATVTVNGVPVVLTAMLDNTSVIDYSTEFDALDGNVVVQCACLKAGRRVGFTYLELEKMD